ncbi:restriction endonuclease subunit S [Thermodesulfobacteriota bacterium]
MNTDWKHSNIGAIAKLATGTTPPSKKLEYFGGDLQWYTPQDVTDTPHLHTSSRTLTDLAVEDNKARLFKAGTILLTAIGNIGRVGILDRKSSANQQITGITLTIDEVDVEYAFYWLLGHRSDILDRASRAVLPIINQAKIKQIPISYPAIDEQHRIVARIKECMERLEEIEGLRAEAMKERDYLLESLVEAEYQEAEGEDVKLVDVCAITSKLVDPREKQYFELLYIGGGNIEAKTSKLLELKTAREEKLKSGKFVFDESMVLYNKIRPYLMKVARPDFPGLCSADMYPLFPDPKRLTRDYLFYLLLSRNFTDYAIAGSNRAGMPKVNRNHLFAYKFTLPSIEKQQRITEALDVAVSAVEELREDMTVSASEANALHESILRKAFAGEL